MKPQTMKFVISPEDLVNSAQDEGSNTIPAISKSTVFKSRRKAREAALQALYQCETLSDWSAAKITEYFENFHNLEIATLGACEGALRFCMELIEGVVLHGVEIDQLISEASENWTLSRMSQVDRNILRLACFEICFMSDIPLSVTISEAIELAKQYSSDEAPKFVNAVIDRIIKKPELGNSYPAVAARINSAILT